MGGKKTLGDWVKILVLLSDEVAVVVLIFLVFDFLDIRVPLLLTVIAATLTAILVFVVHAKVVPSFHWKQITGREGIIGLRGRTIEPLTPVGTVIINGEYWKARTSDGNIGKDEPVEVTRIKGLTLTVKRLGEGQN